MTGPTMSRAQVPDAPRVGCRGWPGDRPRARSHAGQAGLTHLLATLLACLAAARSGAQDETLAEGRAGAVTMRFDVSARAATVAAFAAELDPLELPDWSQGYLAIRSAGAPRPLFITGAGRRGRLTFSFQRNSITGRGGYDVRCDGAAIFEFDDDQVSPDATAEATAGARGPAGRGPWRLTVLSVHSVASRDEGGALHAFLERRDRPMEARNGEKAPPEAFLRATFDIELRSPAGTAVLRDQEGEVRLSVVEAERWGRRHPYWALTIALAPRIDAGTVAPPWGAREGALTVEAVLGAVAWVPGAARLEEVPDVAEGLDDVPGVAVE